MLLNDVDRVEVIRGPGGSVWGANAVNGVVNVIMKDAACDARRLRDDHRRHRRTRHRRRAARRPVRRRRQLPRLRQIPAAGRAGLYRDRPELRRSGADRSGGLPPRVRHAVGLALVCRGRSLSRHDRLFRPARRRHLRRESRRPADPQFFLDRRVQGAGQLRRQLPQGPAAVRGDPAHVRRRRPAPHGARDPPHGRVRRRVPRDARRRSRHRRVLFRSPGAHVNARQPVRAGRNLDCSSEAVRDGGIEIRAERFHGPRGPAHRARPLEPDGPADRLGRRLARGAPADPLRHGSAVPQYGHGRGDAGGQRGLQIGGSDRVRRAATASGRSTG